ncbi:MAG: polysaccharide deacetylase family protein [Chloroflexi bacterium]|nr:polysaccharide deacetylase family protein [Chloroflexota bacterium]
MLKAFRASPLLPFRRWLIFTVLLTVMTGVVLPFSAPAQAQTNTGPFRVYLIFENGPTEVYTPRILNVLADFNIRAAFAVKGIEIEGRENLLQRQIREGHAIINHLWREEGLYAGQREDIVVASYLETEAAIRAALGPELPTYDRQVRMVMQPGGATRPLPVDAITYNWNVDSDDSGRWMPGGVSSANAVINNVLGTPVAGGGERYNAYEFGDGVIITFNDIAQLTVDVLPGILSELRAAGATFGVLPRPGDRVGTMPVVIGAPPPDGPGISGVQLPAEILEGRTRLRAAPSLEARILATGLNPATTLTAIGRRDGWVQVRVGDQVGWVADFLISVRGPLPNLPRS